MYSFIILDLIEMLCTPGSYWRNNVNTAIMVFTLNRNTTNKLIFPVCLAEFENTINLLIHVITPITNLLSPFASECIQECAVRAVCKFN